jgi:uroporphyrinogen-III synthase
VSLPVVLVPRAPERAAGLVDLLRAAGAEAVVAPVIERAPADDLAALDHAVRRLTAGAYAWVVVTSVNAVDALVAAAARTGVALAASARTARWAAVGQATRRSLEDAGIGVDLVPDGEASAAGLVSAFSELSGAGDLSGSRAPESSRTRAVLLPLGDLAGPTLAAGLAGLGWVPDVVTAYRTVRTDLPPDVVARGREGGFTAVVVSSGSVAREVARQLGPVAPVVAIGRPSADAARDAGLTVTAVAEHPTDEALAAAVITVLSDARWALAHHLSDTAQKEHQ